jgi:hypothetical protein
VFAGVGFVEEAFGGAVVVVFAGSVEEVAAALEEEARLGFEVIDAPKGIVGHPGEGAGLVVGEESGGFVVEGGGPKPVGEGPVGESGACGEDRAGIFRPEGAPSQALTDEGGVEGGVGGMESGRDEEGGGFGLAVGAKGAELGERLIEGELIGADGEGDFRRAEGEAEQGEERKAEHAVTTAGGGGSFPGELAGSGVK